MHEVLVAAFGAKIPTYSTILELDRKIRDFPIPSHLQLQNITDTRAGPQVILQQFLVLTMKESGEQSLMRTSQSVSSSHSLSTPQHPQTLFLTGVTRFSQRPTETQIWSLCHGYVSVRLATDRHPFIRSRSYSQCCSADTDLLVPGTFSRRTPNKAWPRNFE